MASSHARKRPSYTAREVAELRERYRFYPAEGAIPLARALAQLSSEYCAVGNYPVARRHMNASLKAARRALHDDSIDDHRRRAVVEFFWDSAILHRAQEQYEAALKDIEEAIAWDRATWDEHAYCFGPRESRHAALLNLKAIILTALGAIEPAREARAEAVLMALSDPDLDDYGVGDMTASIANDMVQALP